MGGPYAASRWRPLPRRRWRRARPARVRMRLRKPCFLLRRRTFGWKGRFMRRVPDKRGCDRAARLRRHPALCQRCEPPDGMPPVSRNIGYTPRLCRVVVATFPDTGIPLYPQCVSPRPKPIGKVIRRVLSFLSARRPRPYTPPLPNGPASLPSVGPPTARRVDGGGDTPGCALLHSCG